MRGKPQQHGMASGSETAPAWLFSFVDLAFLLLIALTQVGGGPRAVDLGEIIVPRVNEDGDQRRSPQVRGSAGSCASTRRQRRIPAPSSCWRRGARGRPARTSRRRRCASSSAACCEARAEKPLLAPHQDSRSQDLLDAIALIEERWPEGRRAAVSPVVAKP